MNKFTISAVIRAVDRFSGPAQRISRGAQAMGRSMTAGVSLPAALAARSVLNTNLRFAEAMNNVQAKSGATGKTLENLKQLALKLGRETSFSASQAAGAMGFLAQAGFNANQILESTPPLLNLARAGMLELAEAADIASNIGGAFNIHKDLEGTTRIVDALAAVAASSNVSVQQLGETMSYVAPVAHTLGVEIEEAAATAGLLGNIGIQASAAGTAMRRLFLKMGDPSSQASKDLEALGINLGEIGEDGKRNLRDMPSILRDVGLAIRRMGTQDRTVFMAELFGTRTIAAGANLAELAASEQMQAYLSAVSREANKGAGQRMADIMNQGLVGAINRLKSTWEGAQLAVGMAGFNSWIGETAHSIADLLTWLSKVNPELLWMATQFVGVAAAIGPTLLAVGLFFGGIVNMITLFGMMGTGIASLVGVLGTLRIALMALAFTPVGLAITAIAIAIALLIKYMGGLDGALLALENFFEGIKNGFAGAFDSEVWEDVLGAFDIIGNAFSDLMALIGSDSVDAASKAFEFGDAVGYIFGSVATIIAQTIRVIADVIVLFTDLVRAFSGVEGAWGDAGQSLQNLLASIYELTFLDGPVMNFIMQATTGFNSLGDAVEWLGSLFDKLVEYIMRVPNAVRELVREFAAANPIMSRFLSAAASTFGMPTVAAALNPVAEVAASTAIAAAPIVSGQSNAAQVVDPTISNADAFAAFQNSGIFGETGPTPEARIAEQNRTQTNNARAQINVDFANLPKGASVESDLEGDGAELEVSRGDISTGSL